MRTVVGTMTGTSMDGVDAVAIEIDGFGLDMQVRYIALTSTDLGDARDLLRQLAKNGGTDEQMSSGAIAVGELTLTSINALALPKIDAIALHGQTVFHAPPTSVQLIDASIIATSFDCAVLTDPRQQDLALGGQGAPITPLADWVLFRDYELSTAVVNLGGFCNITCIPAHASPCDVTGFDLCSCNLLLNTVSQQLLGMEYDEDGKVASTGTPCDAVVEEIKMQLQLQHSEHRSLGTNDDLRDFILTKTEIAPNDLLASIHVAIGACVNDATQEYGRVLLAGGGVFNKVLVSNIAHTGTTETLGVPIQAREGMAMAILGALALDGISITLPQVTGRQETTDVVGWTYAKP